MDILNDIFKKSTPDLNKLEEYGFKKSNNTYIYTKVFFNNDFKLIFTIDKNKNISSKIIDNNLDEEYVAINIKNNTSTYVNEVKEKLKQILEDIKNNCFITSIFIYPQTNRITSYIYNKYNDKPEFLWDNYNHGVFRNKINNKWYGIIMNLETIKSKEYPHNIEVINIKLDREKIKKLLKKNGFYKAYHMNKTDWITIALNDTLKDKEIIELIEESYELVKTSEEWIIPANATYFDVISYFDNNKIIEWKQSSKILIDDIVYIYIGAPYSKIMYKCKAKEVNIPYDYKDDNIKMNYIMKLEVIKKYTKDKLTFKKLNELGIKSIRGPRKITKKISEVIKEVE